MTDSPASDWEILDLGDGRQLARFGEFVVDRPYPAAVDAPRDPAAWTAADLRYDRPSWGGYGQWTAVHDTLPEAWLMAHEGLTFELRAAPSGQVGFFGEQAPMWRRIRAAALPSVLNLFAYTGGGTLVAAAAANGSSVTHVDASRSAVAWARRNADLSGLGDAPIRWIVDDALAFTLREARRDRLYDAVVLDPPSYGHGPKGERWTLDDQLPALLDACLAVAAPGALLLLTAHAEGWQPADAAAELAEALERAGRSREATDVESGWLELRATSGAVAPAGVFAGTASR